MSYLKAFTFPVNYYVFVFPSLADSAIGILSFFYVLKQTTHGTTVSMSHLGRCQDVQLLNPPPQTEHPGWSQLSMVLRQQGFTNKLWMVYNTFTRRDVHTVHLGWEKEKHRDQVLEVVPIWSIQSYLQYITSIFNCSLVFSNFFIKESSLRDVFSYIFLLWVGYEFEG